MENTPKCGTYASLSEDEIQGFQLPILQLNHPEAVLQDSVNEIRQDLLTEQDTEVAVVFDTNTLHLLQQAFDQLADASHMISCQYLPQLLSLLQVQVKERDLAAFLIELNASISTLISFSDCIEMLSLLAEEQETED